MPETNEAPKNWFAARMRKVGALARQSRELAEILKLKRQELRSLDIEIASIEARMRAAVALNSPYQD